MLFDLGTGITSSEYFGAGYLPTSSFKWILVTSLFLWHTIGLQRPALFIGFPSHKLIISPNLLHHMSTIAHYLTRCINQHFLFEIKTCYSDTVVTVS